MVNAFSAENLKTISELPKKILSKNIPNILEIRCEIYIGKADFKKSTTGPKKKPSQNKKKGSKAKTRWKKGKGT